MVSNDTLTFDPIDSGDTGWLAMCCILMMLMIPAVGILYSGLVRQKNSMTVLVQSVAIYSIIGVLWTLLGFSLSFAPTCGGYIGDYSYFGYQIPVETVYKAVAPTTPILLFFFYNLAACAVTGAIVVGSAGERLNVPSALLFTSIWTLIVYCPVCHWIWGPGWLHTLGATDYAGGAVVHMCAGYSSLALSVAIGKRHGAPEKVRAHNNSYVAFGITLLWFGWFGFNGGSAYAANYGAALAIVSTNLAASASSLSWALTDYLFTGKVLNLSFLNGAAVGLIAMTAGAGYCAYWSSLIIGLIGGILSACWSRFRTKYQFYDDATDVFSAHGICGTWGIFASGLFARAKEGGFDGAFFDRGVQLGYQVSLIVTVAPYCYILSYAIAYAMNMFGLLRISKEDEERGLDLVNEEYSYIIVRQWPKEVEDDQYTVSTSMASHANIRKAIPEMVINEAHAETDRPINNNEKPTDNKYSAVERSPESKLPEVKL